MSEATVSAVTKIQDAMRGYPGTLTFEQMGLTAEEVAAYKAIPRKEPKPSTAHVPADPMTVKQLLPRPRYPNAELSGPNWSGNYYVWDMPEGSAKPNIIGEFDNHADALFYTLAVRGELARAAVALYEEFADNIFDHCERHGVYFKNRMGERCEHCAEDAAQDAEMRDR